MNTCADAYLLEWLLGIQRGANVKHRGIKLIVLTWLGTSVLFPRRYASLDSRVEITLLPPVPIESSVVSDLCFGFLGKRTDERENARCRPRREFK